MNNQAKPPAKIKEALIKPDPALYADMKAYLDSGEWHTEYESETALWLGWDRGWLHAIAAFDLLEARELIARVPKGDAMVLRGCNGLRELAYEFGFNGCEPCRQAVYERNEPLPVSAELVIRHPDEKDFQKVFDTYFMGSEEEIREDVDSPDFLGGYLDGQMVGYIGLHGEGSMGMLYVFPEFRRRGYAEALYRTLINNQLKKGRKPFAQIIAGNEASLALQKKLGLRVSNGIVYWTWRGE